MQTARANTRSNLYPTYEITQTAYINIVFPDQLIATMSLKLAGPLSILISGPSNCGKSTLVHEMLINKNEVFDPPPRNVVICYAHMQNMYADLQKNLDVPVQLREGLDADLQLPEHSLLIIDDLQGTVFLVWSQISLIISTRS